jgi:tRNA-specific 2-thiouridylase
MQMKIAVGLSGGVDSAVAAFLLKEQKHDVYGVTMKIWSGDDSPDSVKHACYGPGEESEIRRAAEICDVIGITHHVFDLSAEYEKTILGYFKNEYLAGRTPNPCVLCNQSMKFGLLPEAAFGILDVEIFATGHYAITETDDVSGRSVLRKAYDLSKDQSYFIHRLTQLQLSRALFPLGRLMKEEVREIARKNGIPSWNDPESQDFYEGDYKELINHDDEPGDIVDIKGSVIGKHQGIWNYTIGQRRGIGIAAAEPLYVTEIDASMKRVIVAPKHESVRGSFIATQFNWVSKNSADKSMQYTVKTRSSQKGSVCTVEPVNESVLKIHLEKPESGIAAGQSAVLYEGDMVIGGGIIEYN